MAIHTTGKSHSDPTLSRGSIVSRPIAAMSTSGTTSTRRSGRRSHGTASVAAVVTMMMEMPAVNVHDVVACGASACAIRTRMMMIPASSSWASHTEYVRVLTAGVNAWERANAPPRKRLLWVGVTMARVYGLGVERLSRSARLAGRAARTISATLRSVTCCTDRSGR
ncbi:hypothetical protein MIPYR_40200 [uncultured Microbacterium sp.]|uniref:Uncharacterized protein n=1 Tax=uncultured Microbacterium sp. TaxID=191216 RepID=A0A1Y5PBH2_9MICO|nr:hypothetical protein MIPYR_40200 [uncultured Microbacterium sp.]